MRMSRLFLRSTPMRNLLPCPSSSAAVSRKASAPSWVRSPMVEPEKKPGFCPRGAPARGQKLGFFSGSTIGNLTHDEAKAFLDNAAELLGQGSKFLIGVDLKKSLDILLPAYDDDGGVTASFSLNMLARVNRDLDGDFDTTRFAHCALYNDEKGRIEIYLQSLVDQKVRVLGRAFSFAKDERIHTENSHKYSIPEFQVLAETAGWRPVKAWTDADNLFSLHLLQLG